MTVDETDPAPIDDYMGMFRERLVGRTALLLEDEDTVRDHVASLLWSVGFARVDQAITGEEAVAHAHRRAYDICILDRMTPAMDGLTALRSIRASPLNTATPAVFLSALGSERHRLEGLAEGDDYLVKPVSDAELFARIAVLLRRSARSTGAADDGPLAVGALTVDRHTLRATMAGNVIDLTSREFAVLALLAENAGMPVTRSMLWAQCWPTFTFEPSNFVNTIDVQISRLRRKLTIAGNAAGIDASGVIVAMRVQGFVLRPPCA